MQFGCSLGVCGFGVVWVLFGINLEKKRKLIVSQVSSHHVEFLDLTASVVKGAIVVQPTLSKLPTPPLCPSSAHHPSIHDSWPRAVVHRTLSLAWDGEAALVKLRSVYSQANAADSTMRLLRRNVDKQSVRPSRAAEGCDIVACVLRYHPAFPFALMRAQSLAPMPQEFNLMLRPFGRMLCHRRLVSSRRPMQPIAEARLSTTKGINLPRWVGRSLLSHWMLNLRLLLQTIQRM